MTNKSNLRSPLGSVFEQLNPEGFFLAVRPLQLYRTWSLCWALWADKGRCRDFEKSGGGVENHAQAILRDSVITSN